MILYKGRQMNITYIRVCICLQQLDPTSFWAFIHWYPVTSNGGKNKKLAILQQVIELDTKKWLAMIFFDKRAENLKGLEEIQCEKKEQIT